MAKITIEIDKNNDLVVAYDNNNTVYPICKVSKNSFIISEETNIAIISLIAETTIKFGKSLEYQLIKQGFINKPLNKPDNDK